MKGFLPALAAWILALLLVAGTFAAVCTPAQDRPPSGDPSITWRAQSHTWRACSPARPCADRSICSRVWG